MNSLCIHGAKEMGTGQTAPHLNLQSRAGHMGKGDLQCQGSGWWIQRSKREPVNSPEVWTLPKTYEMSAASCLLLFGESKLRGWPVALSLLLWLGSVRGQSSPKTSPISTRSGEGSLLEGKGQVPRGNIKFSMVTWWDLEKQIKLMLNGSEPNFIPNEWGKRSECHWGQIQYIWL